MGHGSWHLHALHSPDPSLSYILNAQRSFSSGDPLAVMSVAIMNSCKHRYYSELKLSWSCCNIYVITKCALFSHYNLDICKNREMLKCSDKESGRGCCNLSVWWGCALCSWRCKSPWNRYCRFHPCRRSWRSGRRRPWRCRRGESWSTSPGSCPCSAGRQGSPAWSLCNATTTLLCWLNTKYHFICKRPAHQMSFLNSLNWRQKIVWKGH